MTIGSVHFLFLLICKLSVSSCRARKPIQHSNDNGAIAATELRELPARRTPQIWSDHLEKTTPEHHGIAIVTSRFGEWLRLRARTGRSYGSPT